MTSPQNGNSSMREEEGHFFNSSCLSPKGRMGHDSPPVDVIVFQREEPIGPSNQKSPLRSSLKSTLVPSGLEMSTSMFRLMPRNNMKTTPSFSSKGRKRSSASISPGIFSNEDSLDVTAMRDITASTSSRTQKETTSGSTISLREPLLHDCYLESPGGLSSTLSNLNALTLRTPPHRRTCSLNSKAMGHTSPPTSLCDSVAQSVLLAKSSFSRYSGSPATERSVLSPFDTATRSTPMKLESPAGSAFSSPKIAPLTVLSHDGRNYPATPFRQALFSHSGEEDKDLQPQMVRWRASGRSIDSFNTIDGNRNNETSRLREQIENSPKSPIAKSILEGILLPQVSSTPRSSGTHGSYLPRFPSLLINGALDSALLCLEHEGKQSPKDIEMTDENVQNELEPLRMTQDTVCSTVEEDNIIPFASLPNLDFPKEANNESSLNNPVKPWHKSISQLTSGRSRSLLKRTESEGSILAEMYCSDYLDDENESLNFSDDEGTFFLVAPSNLRTTKSKQDTRNKKMRKLQEVATASNDVATYFSPANLGFSSPCLTQEFSYPPQVYENLMRGESTYPQTASCND